MMDRVCANCRWWRGQTGDAHGLCIRHAPLATGGLHGPVETRWPETASIAWCGDFEERDQ